MKADDLIHKKRNSAFSIKVGDPNDMTPIGDMFATDDDLYVIKSKAIYSVKLADDIDPDRTNLNLPNLQKTVLNHGLENEIVVVSLRPQKPYLIEFILALTSTRIRLCQMLLS